MIIGIQYDCLGMCLPADTALCFACHTTTQGPAITKKKKNWTNLCIPLQITQQTIKHEKVLSGKQNPVMHFHGSKLFGVL